MQLQCAQIASNSLAIAVYLLTGKDTILSICSLDSGLTSVCRQFSIVLFLTNGQSRNLPGAVGGSRAGEVQCTTATAIMIHKDVFFHNYLPTKSYVGRFICCTVSGAADSVGAMRQRKGE